MMCTGRRRDDHGHDGDLEKAVNSDLAARALAIVADGVTTFGGAVGGLRPLASLTTDAAGSTDVNGSPIRAGVVTCGTT